MLDRSNAAVAERNADTVRRWYPVQFMQVRPCYDFPYNVQLRIGTGEWTTLYVSDAIAFTRLARRGQRRLLRSPKALKKRRDALLARGITP
jgi:hypothetical protein